MAYSEVRNRATQKYVKENFFSHPLFPCASSGARFQRDTLQRCIRSGGNLLVGMNLGGRNNPCGEKEQAGDESRRPK